MVRIVCSILCGLYHKKKKMFLMALTNAPALEIPDLNKLFILFSPEKQGINPGNSCPKGGTSPMADGISLQAVGPSGLWLPHIL